MADHQQNTPTPAPPSLPIPIPTAFMRQVVSPPDGQVQTPSEAHIGSRIISKMKEFAKLLRDPLLMPQWQSRELERANLEHTTLSLAKYWNNSNPNIRESLQKLPHQNCNFVYFLPHMSASLIFMMSDKLDSMNTPAISGSKSQSRPETSISSSDAIPGMFPLFSEGEYNLDPTYSENNNHSRMELEAPLHMSSFSRAEPSSSGIVSTSTLVSTDMESITESISIVTKTTTTTTTWTSTSGESKETASPIPPSSTSSSPFWSSLFTQTPAVSNRFVEIHVIHSAPPTDEEWEFVQTPFVSMQAPHRSVLNPEFCGIIKDLGDLNVLPQRLSSSVNTGWNAELSNQVLGAIGCLQDVQQFSGDYLDAMVGMKKVNSPKIDTYSHSNEDVYKRLEKSTTWKLYKQTLYTLFRLMYRDIPILGDVLYKSMMICLVAFMMDQTTKHFKTRTDWMYASHIIANISKRSSKLSAIVEKVEAKDFLNVNPHQRLVLSQELGFGGSPFYGSNKSNNEIISSIVSVATESIQYARKMCLMMKSRLDNEWNRYYDWMKQKSDLSIFVKNLCNPSFSWFTSSDAHLKFNINQIKFMLNSTLSSIDGRDAFTQQAPWHLSFDLSSCSLIKAFTHLNEFLKTGPRGSNSNLPASFGRVFSLNLVHDYFCSISNQETMESHLRSLASPALATQAIFELGQLFQSFQSRYARMTLPAAADSEKKVVRSKFLLTSISMMICFFRIFPLGDEHQTSLISEYVLLPWKVHGLDELWLTSRLQLDALDYLEEWIHTAHYHGGFNSTFSFTKASLFYKYAVFLDTVKSECGLASARNNDLRQHTIAASKIATQTAIVEELTQWLNKEGSRLKRTVDSKIAQNEQAKRKWKENQIFTRHEMPASSYPHPAYLNHDQSDMCTNCPECRKITETQSKRNKEALLNGHVNDLPQDDTVARIILFKRWARKHAYWSIYFSILKDWIVNIGYDRFETNKSPIRYNWETAPVDSIGIGSTAPWPEYNINLLITPNPSPFIWPTIDYEFWFTSSTSIFVGSSTSTGFKIGQLSSCHMNIVAEMTNNLISPSPYRPNDWMTNVDAQNENKAIAVFENEDLANAGLKRNYYLSLASLRAGGNLQIPRIKVLLDGPKVSLTPNSRIDIEWLVESCLYQAGPSSDQFAKGSFRVWKRCLDDPAFVSSFCETIVTCFETLSESNSSFAFRILFSVLHYLVNASHEKIHILVCPALYFATDSIYTKLRTLQLHAQQIQTSAGSEQMLEYVSVQIIDLASAAILPYDSTNQSRRLSRSDMAKGGKPIDQLLYFVALTCYFNAMLGTKANTRPKNSLHSFMVPDIMHQYLPFITSKIQSSPTYLFNILHGLMPDGIYTNWYPRGVGWFESTVVLKGTKTPEQIVFCVLNGSIQIAGSGAGDLPYAIVSDPGYSDVFGNSKLTASMSVHGDYIVPFNKVKTGRFILHEFETSSASSSSSSSTSTIKQDLVDSYDYEKYDSLSRPSDSFSQEDEDSDALNDVRVDIDFKFGLFSKGDVRITEVRKYPHGQIQELIYVNDLSSIKDLPMTFRHLGLWIDPALKIGFFRPLKFSDPDFFNLSRCSFLLDLNRNEIISTRSTTYPDHRLCNPQSSLFQAACGVFSRLEQKNFIRVWVSPKNTTFIELCDIKLHFWTDPQNNTIVNRENPKYCIASNQYRGVLHGYELGLLLNHIHFPNLVDPILILPNCLLTKCAYPSHSGSFLSILSSSSNSPMQNPIHHQLIYAKHSPLADEIKYFRYTLERFMKRIKSQSPTGEIYMAYLMNLTSSYMAEPLLGMNGFAYAAGCLNRYSTNSPLNANSQYLLQEIVSSVPEFTFSASNGIKVDDSASKSMGLFYVGMEFQIRNSFGHHSSFVKSLHSTNTTSQKILMKYYHLFAPYIPLSLRIPAWDEASSNSKNSLYRYTKLSNIQFDLMNDVISLSSLAYNPEKCTFPTPFMTGFLNMMDEALPSYQGYGKNRSYVESTSVEPSFRFGSLYEFIRTDRKSARLRIPFILGFEVVWSSTGSVLPFIYHLIGCLNLNPKDMIPLPSKLSNIPLHETIQLTLRKKFWVVVEQDEATHKQQQEFKLAREQESENVEALIHFFKHSSSINFWFAESGKLESGKGILPHPNRAPFNWIAKFNSIIWKKAQDLDYIKKMLQIESMVPTGPIVDVRKELVENSLLDSSFTISSKKLPFVKHAYFGNPIHSWRQEDPLNDHVDTVESDDENRDAAPNLEISSIPSAPSSSNHSTTPSKNNSLLWKLAKTIFKTGKFDQVEQQLDFFFQSCVLNPLPLSLTQAANLPNSSSNNLSTSSLSPTLPPLYPADINANAIIEDQNEFFEIEQMLNTDNPAFKTSIGKSSISSLQSSLNAFKEKRKADDGEIVLPKSSRDFFADLALTCQSTSLALLENSSELDMDDPIVQMRLACGIEATGIPMDLIKSIRQNRFSQPSQSTSSASNPNIASIYDQSIHSNVSKRPLDKHLRILIASLVVHVYQRKMMRCIDLLSPEIIASKSPINSRHPLYQELKSAHASCWNLEENPEWILVELEQGIVIRDIQAQVAHAMLDKSELFSEEDEPQEGETIGQEDSGNRAESSSPSTPRKKTSYSGRCLQLNMGEGKTSVILPSICAALGMQKIIPRVVAIPAQLPSVHSALLMNLGGLLQIPVFLFPFNRDTPVTQYHLKSIYAMLQKCRNEGGIILASPEHILAFRLKYQLVVSQCTNSHHPCRAKDNFVVGNYTRKEVEYEMRRIMEFWSTHVMEVLDESDEILRHKFHLVYPIGMQQPVDGRDKRWKTSAGVLEIVQLVTPSFVKNQLEQEGINSLKNMSDEDKAFESGEQKPKPQPASPFTTQFSFNPSDNPEQWSFIQIQDKDIWPKFQEALVDAVLDGQGPSWAFQNFSIRSFNQQTRKDVKQWILDPSIDISVESIEIHPSWEKIRAAFGDQLEVLFILRGLFCYQVLNHVLSMRYSVDFGLSASNIASPSSQMAQKKEGDEVKDEEYYAKQREKKEDGQRKQTKSIEAMMFADQLIQSKQKMDEKRRKRKNKSGESPNTQKQEEQEEQGDGNDNNNDDTDQGNSKNKIPRIVMSAVPYRAKDTPAPRAEFEHVDVMILCTLISYYNVGLTLEQFIACIQYFLTFSIQMKEDFLSFWISLYSHPLTGQYGPNRPNISNPDMIDTSDMKMMEDLYSKMRMNRGVLCLWIFKYVFEKETLQFPYKVSAASPDIVPSKLFKSSGFSGTNDTRDLLPLNILQKEVPSLSHTNALAIDLVIRQSSKLKCQLKETHTFQNQINLRSPLVESLTASLKLYSKHKKIKLLHEREDIHLLGDSSLTGKQLLSSLLKCCHLDKAGNLPRALIDAGALIVGMTNLEVAKEMLRLLPPSSFDAVVFFDRSDVLVIIDRQLTVIPFTNSPYLNNMSRVFVYLDDHHTRGTDLKLPLQTHAWVTLCAKLNKDKLLQACARLRQMGAGQTACFIAPPQVYNQLVHFSKTEKRLNEDIKITSERKLAADSNQTSIVPKVRHVILWSIFNSLELLQQAMPLWLEQNWRHVIGNLGISAINRPDLYMDLNGIGENYSLEHMYSKGRRQGNAAQVMLQWLSAQIKNVEKILSDHQLNLSGMYMKSPQTLQQIELLKKKVDQILRDFTMLWSGNLESSEQEREVEQEVEVEVQRVNESASSVELNLAPTLEALLKLAKGQPVPEKEFFTECPKLQSLLPNLEWSDHFSSIGWDKRIVATLQFIRTAKHSYQHSTPQWNYDHPLFRPPSFVLLWYSTGGIPFNQPNATPMINPSLIIPEHIGESGAAEVDFLNHKLIAAILLGPQEANQVLEQLYNECPPGIGLYAIGPRNHTHAQELSYFPVISRIFDLSSDHAMIHSQLSLFSGSNFFTFIRPRELAIWPFMANVHPGIPTSAPLMLDAIQVSLGCYFAPILSNDPTLKSEWKKLLDSEMITSNGYVVKSRLPAENSKPEWLRPQTLQFIQYIANTTTTSIDPGSVIAKFANIRGVTNLAKSDLVVFHR